MIASAKRKYLCLLEFAMWLIAAVYLFPIYLEITIALKSQNDFARNLFGLPKVIVFQNLIDVFKKMRIPIVTMNSLFIATTVIIILLLCSSLAAYAIARRNNGLFKGIYIFFMAGMMVPFQLAMIPLYKLIRDLGLMNSYLGVVCIYTAECVPLGIMIFTGFIKSIPRVLDESATIDGCSYFMVYRKIILPFLRLSIIPVIVLNIVFIWNDLLTPLLFLGSKHLTIITALYNFRGATYTTDWTMVFAGSVITMIPLVVIFLFLQRYFIEGMVLGAVKG